MGGGTGFIYHRIKRGFTKNENVKWHVVDNEQLTTIGKEYCEDSEDSLFFYPSINLVTETMTKFDVLYINTVLQYISDYRKLFMSLFSYKPEYIILTRLLSGRDIPTFVTQQTIFKKKTPCIFINLDELVAFMKTNGYNPIFVSQEQSEDMRGHYENNIPTKLRVPCSLNVCFMLAE